MPSANARSACCEKNNDVATKTAAAVARPCFASRQWLLAEGVGVAAGFSVVSSDDLAVVCTAVVGVAASQARARQLLLPTRPREKGEDWMLGMKACDRAQTVVQYIGGRGVIENRRRGNTLTIGGTIVRSWSLKAAH